MVEEKDSPLNAINPMPSNHPGQSQKTQTIQWTNQISKKIHVADIKHREMSAREF